MIISDFYLAGCVVASVVTSLRWFRVAQREHYLPLSATRFAIRWWKRGGTNSLVFLLAVSAAITSAWFPVASLITAVAITFGPIGLGIKGRTSALAWTRRLRTLTATSLVLIAAIFVLVRQLNIRSIGFAVTALLVPCFIDIALTALKPIEQRMARRYVADASTPLERVHPIRVAITGSYGKTTIKG